MSLKQSLRNVNAQHRALVKELMTEIETLQERYNITLPEYHHFRSRLKAGLIRLNNNWFQLFIDHLGKSWENKINRKGAIPETHLNEHHLRG